MNSCRAGNKYMCDGILYRSKNEFLFAEWLNNLEIPFQYEPFTIKLSNGGFYKPDFVLTNQKTIIEVKPIAFLNECENKIDLLLNDSNFKDYQLVVLTMVDYEADNPVILKMSVLEEIIDFEKGKISHGESKIWESYFNKMYFIEYCKQPKLINFRDRYSQYTLNSEYEIYFGYTALITTKGDYFEQRYYNGKFTNFEYPRKYYT